MSRYVHPFAGSRRMRRAHLLAAVRALPIAVTHRFVPLVVRLGEHALVDGIWTPLPTKRGRGGRR